MKKFKNLGILLLSTLVLSACSDSSASQTDVTASEAKTVQKMIALPEKVTYDDHDYFTDWSKQNPTMVKLNGKNAAITGSGVAVKDGTVTITAAGTYVLSGKLEDGQILVDVKDKGIVRLVLNGVEIHKSNNAPIYIQESGKTIISLQEGTENLLADGKNDANSDSSSDKPNAAIFSEDDLSINGNGKLVVHGNYNNGITSKDDLKITGGTMEIHATDDGLIGRDLVAVQGGNITIEAGGDGIRATNDTDDSKGFIGIEKGSFNIKAGSDGIQAATSVVIDGGTYTMVSGGGSKNRLGPRGDQSSPSVAEAEETEAQSAKAVKAGAHIVVNKGTFHIDSADDAIHSNDSVTIAGGDLSIASGDDGIHAASSIKTTGGTINISKSYEGIESKVVTISDGNIHVVASDDGINIAGGNDGSGMDMHGVSEGSELHINGGYVYVDASGDGLDSNGSIYMKEGTVIVNGPTENNNAPLDYNGSFEMSGGSLIAAGSSGMAQAVSEQSAQNAVLMTYSQTQAADTLVHLEDGKGNTVATFAPNKDYQSIMISSPKLSKDATYTLYTGGTSTESENDGLYTDGKYEGGNKIVQFTITESVTWLNEAGVTTARSSGRGGPNGPGSGQNRPDMFADLDGETKEKAQAIMAQEREGTITREEAQAKLAELGIQLPERRRP